MRNDQIQSRLQKGASLGCIALLVLLPAVPVFAQNPGQLPYPGPAPAPVPQAQAPAPALAPTLTPDQLDNIVAPVALYPDPLLGQVLAASTYPLELVEAQQWLQQNPNLHGQQLMDAARQQNWDPSVQAIVAFPDVLAMLNRDVQWTTDLGNAFLAQQNDVMAAVQRMRQRAQQNGNLQSNPQQAVTTQTQNGQNAIVIQPVNPQVIYVPVYNPVYVWGPPVWGYYPPLWYPSVGFGFGFGPGIYLSSFFPGWGFGWGGWGLGWGWGCGWFGGGLFVNVGFFNHWGFHSFYGGPWHGGFGARGFAGQYAWAHDAFHRAGVGYGNAAVAARYNNARFAAGRSSASAMNAGRSYANNMARSSNYGRGFANSSPRGFANSSRGYAGTQGNVNRGYAGNQGYARNYGGSAFNGGTRSYAAPNYGGARSFNGGNYGGTARSFSGGGNSAGRSFGGGGYSGGRSFGGGGFSGGRSFGGGGGHVGGGGGHGGGGHR